jgi:hypothetical protein
VLAGLALLAVWVVATRIEKKEADVVVRSELRAIVRPSPGPQEPTVTATAASASIASTPIVSSDRPASPSRRSASPLGKRRRTAPKAQESPKREEEPPRPSPPPLDPLADPH